MRKTLLLFIAGFIPLLLSAQCDERPRDGFYSRKPILSREHFLMRYIKTIKEEDKALVLEIDTLENEVYYNPLEFQKGRFIIYIDSNNRYYRKYGMRLKRPDKVYIKDNETGKVFYLGKNERDVGRYLFSTNDFLYLPAAEEPIVFYFDSKTIVPASTCSEILGEYKDSLYIMLDTNIGKKREIINLRHIKLISRNGVNVLSSDTVQITTPKDLIFFNNKYSVSKTFYMQQEIDCKKYFYYIITVKNYNQVIDTFITPNADYIYPFLTGDSLDISYEQKLKRYYNNKKIIDIDGASLNNEFTANSCYYSHSINISNHLVSLYVIKSTSTPEFITEGDKKITWNGLSAENPVFKGQLFLAFNLYTQKFVGYPKIIFTQQP